MDTGDRGCVKDAPAEMGIEASVTVIRESADGRGWRGLRAPLAQAASAFIAASTPSGVSGNIRRWKMAAIICVDCE